MPLKTKAPARRRTQLALQLRLTHQYVPGWSSGDEWRAVGGYSLLSARKVQGDWESWNWINTVRVDVSPGASQKEIKRALLDTFVWGCRCEHDCCGHVQGFAYKAVHIKGREWMVHGRSSRNV